MIVDCISDMHGHYPELKGGDLLIVAGDLTARDTKEEYLFFFSWLTEQKYKKIVYIAGNHDNLLYDNTVRCSGGELEHLCDSGTEFEGLKIWGSPWTKTFPGINPRCMAFTVDSEEKLREKFRLIPKDTDILITHSPPWGFLDRVGDKGPQGSWELYETMKKVMPKLHVFGHIHESYGRVSTMDMHFVNASYVNERYQPVNQPIRIEL